MNLSISNSSCKTVVIPRIHVYSIHKYNSIPPFSLPQSEKYFRDQWMHCCDFCMSDSINTYLFLNFQAGILWSEAELSLGSSSLAILSVKGPVLYKAIWDA